ncbi:MAG: hypothetical protein MUC60_00990 [Oscillatoria sp. Prado101]|nr:hypothetical protein [Oscillatoria sp. Prado101]
MLNKVLDWDGVGIRRWEWARVSCRCRPIQGQAGRLSYAFGVWARVSCRWPSRGGDACPTPGRR